MRNCMMTKSQTFQGKSQLSEESSLTKISRKKQISRSKGSCSRSNSRKSLQNDSLSGFYIKTITTFSSTDKAQEKSTSKFQRLNKLMDSKNNSNRTQKKRQATPAKGLRDQQNMMKTVKRQNGFEIEKQMQIHELQKKLANQAKIRIVYQQKATQFQGEVIQQVKKLKARQKQLNELKERQSEYLHKIKQLQKLADFSNNQAINTKSTLQKLKITIKQNRTSELQAQLSNMAKCLHENKQQNILLSQQNTRLNRQLQSKNNELNKIKLKINLGDMLRIQSINQQMLKKQIQKLKKDMTKDKSEKQIFLESKIQEKQREIYKHKLEINNLNVKIAYMNRKKNQQLEYFRKKNQKQVKVLRQKFCNLMDQFKRINKKSNSKQVKNPQSVSPQKRGNRFCASWSAPRKNSQDDQILITLSLSPENK